MAALSKWVVPNPEQAKAYMAAAVTAPADVAVLSETTALKVCLENEVLRVRGLVAKGGRVPLSETEGSVPPEGLKHVLVLALGSVLSSVPTLAEFAEGDRFKKMVEEADAWVKDVGASGSVSQPDDPDENWVSMSSYGAYSGEEPEAVDLATDGL